MNALVSLLGIESWKPVLTALLLPPVPLLLLVLLGTRLVTSRRGLGWLVVLVATAGLWLGACAGTADLLGRTIGRPPPPLAPEQIAQLRAEAKAQPGRTAIVVLGGGRELLAPEIGMADLKPRSLERLRYGIWLQRETGLPLAFSGGVGWGAAGGASEAEIAERVAAREFGASVRWVEKQSRDTRENALRSLALLERNGVTRVVLVTHGWHMPRAWRYFQTAGAGRVEIVAAPMGLARATQQRLLDWLPTPEGYVRVQLELRELLGRAVAAT